MSHLCKAYRKLAVTGHYHGHITPCMQGCISTAAECIITNKFNFFITADLIEVRLECACLRFCYNTFMSLNKVLFGLSELFPYEVN